MSTMRFLILATLLLPILTVYGNPVKQFFAGLQGGKPNLQLAGLKTEILTLARSVNRGLTETSADRDAMLKLFEQLEKKNKYKDSLKSPLINAVWDLEYTTSDSILGRGGSARFGPILQTIDAPNLFAKNTEVRVRVRVRVRVNLFAESTEAPFNLNILSLSLTITLTPTLTLTSALTPTLTLTLTYSLKH
jgi:hypothetical protein